MMKIKYAYFRGHPRVGPRRRHSGGLVHFSRQAEVGNLERFVF